VISGVNMIQILGNSPSGACGGRNFNCCSRCGGGVGVEKYDAHQPTMRTCSYIGLQTGNDQVNSFNYVTPNSAIKKCFVSLSGVEKGRLEQSFYNSNAAGIVTVEPPKQVNGCE
jgi:hypothetical protein